MYHDSQGNPKRRINACPRFVCDAVANDNRKIGARAHDCQQVDSCDREQFRPINMEVIRQVIHIDYRRGFSNRNAAMAITGAAHIKKRRRLRGVSESTMAELPNRPAAKCPTVANPIAQPEREIKKTVGRNLKKRCSPDPGR